MRLLRYLFLVLFLSGWAWSQDASSVYYFRGEPYRFKTAKVGDVDVWSLDDPEVQKLVAATFARLQLSTTGKTLYVFLPGRDSYWNDNLEVYTRNGVERPAPGKFYGSPSRMEPAALLEALGLKAYPGQDSVQLASLVTEIRLSSPESAEMRLQASAPIKFTVQETDLGLVRVTLNDGAWDLPERTLQLGEAQVEVSGGDAANSPLVLQFRFLPFWTARVKTGLTREILVSPEARHFSAPKEQARLQEVVSSAEQGDREVEFRFDRPVQFFWAQIGSQLTVEFPAVQSAATQVRQIQNASYTTSRYQTQVQEGQKFEFYQSQERPNSLFLKVGAEIKKVADPSGTASMAGVSSGGVIVIDPGHGGGDPGCRNRSLNVYEKDVTLDISLRLRDILQQRGWRVELTRTTDRDVTYAGSPDLMELQARADVANKNGADLFVSIHCNASVSPAVRGSSIYWYKPEDRRLAECLDVLDGSLGFEQDGIIQNRFAVLRLTGMPAVLVETAFLTNAVEGRLLADPKIRQAIAEKLADGLDRYWSESGAPSKSKTR